MTFTKYASIEDFDTANAPAPAVNPRRIILPLVNELSCATTAASLELPPPGTYAATVGRIDHLHRGMHQGPGIQPHKGADIVVFQFEFRDREGVMHLVPSLEMTVGGQHEGSLFVFLWDLLQHPPLLGWSCDELKGSSCRITVVHLPLPNGGYEARAVAVAPAVDSEGTLLVQLPLATNLTLRRKGIPTEQYIDLFTKHSGAHL